MMRCSLPLRPLVLLLLSPFLRVGAVDAWAGQEVIDRLTTITSPPSPLCTQASHLPHLQPRDSSSACQYGSCGGTCLSQGAFCCNPGGTSFTPNWVCDNGACITSVRGDTGVVDCYDPDNPSGTTQSCIDFKRTATCSATDRCYTCSSEEPFCHWQTWIASNSPTLRWFSCVSDKAPDETFLAEIITAAPSSKSSSVSSSSASASATSATSASPTSTSSLPTSTAPATSSSTVGAGTATPSSPALTTGAIVGIAVGGAALLILLTALLIYCLRRRRRRRHDPTTQQEQQQSASRPQISHPSPIAELSTPVYHYPTSLAGSASQTGTTPTTTAAATAVTTDDPYWRYHSNPNLVGAEDRFKMRMPVELPVGSNNNDTPVGHGRDI